jgi:MFS family permease
MLPNDPSRPTIATRRRARGLAYRNGGLWAIGNGLCSTMLVVYVAMEFDVPGEGLAISLILAAPRLVGLLRLVAPAMIGRLASRKRFCIGGFALSALTLFGLPLAVAPGVFPSARASLTALVVLWCVYHLLQYVATVALWSWLADLVPGRIRGRFFGRRERWMVAGQAVAMIAAGLFVWGWRATHPEWPRWIGYAIPSLLGAGFMLAALLPLAAMPSITRGQAARHGASLRSMLAPLADVRFLRYLFFRCWLSFANGISGFAQAVYPYRVLNLGLLSMHSLKTGMRLGQWTLGPAVGRLADRAGNRPVLIASYLLVAQGPLFYLLATAAAPWWIVAAWIVWIAWVGLNVCLPNLMLKLSPTDQDTPYIATFYAIDGVFHAAAVVLGGLLYDYFRTSPPDWSGNLGIDYFAAIFALGWLLRLSGVVVLWLIVREPRGKGP